VEPNERGGSQGGRHNAILRHGSSADSWRLKIRLLIVIVHMHIVVVYIYIVVVNIHIHILQCSCEHTHCSCEHTHCSCEHTHCSCVHTHFSFTRTHCGCEHKHCSCEHTHCIRACRNEDLGLNCQLYEGASCLICFTRAYSSLLLGTKRGL
jgi:hypothetical protein